MNSFNSQVLEHPHPAEAGDFDIILEGGICVFESPLEK